MFLEECKYVAKEKKIPKYIIGNIEVSSDSNKENCDKENSDEDNYHEKNSNELNSDEKNSDEGNLKILFINFLFYIWKW